MVFGGDFLYWKAQVSHKVFLEGFYEIETPLQISMVIVSERIGDQNETDQVGLQIVEVCMESGPILADK
jgi:hypothetical protein